MNHAKLAYEHADRAVHHWRLILGGSLSPAQRQHARIELIRAVGQRVRTRLALQDKEVANEVVAA
jgi:hypothetical protein